MLDSLATPSQRVRRGLSVLDTVAAPKDVALPSDSHPLPPPPVAEELRPEPILAEEPQQRQQRVGAKRGRKPGSNAMKAILRDAEANAAHKTRNEICQAASRARWQRVREERAAAAPLAVDAQEDHQIVPYDPAALAALQIVPYRSMEDEELTLAVMGVKPSMKDKKELEITKENAKVLNLFTGCIIASTAIAKVVKLDQKTVTRRVRLMAAFVLIFRRNRINLALKAVHAHIKTVYPNSNGLQFIEKAKYDEMSLKLRVAECQTKDDQQRKEVVQKEPALVKLLQVTTTYGALWEVEPGKHICAIFRGPTTVRSIERNNGESLKDGLTREV